MRTSRSLLAAALVFIAACKKAPPTSDEVLAQAKPVLEPKVAAMEKIGRAPLPRATNKITLAGPPIRAISGGTTLEPSANATLLFDRDLKDEYLSYARVDLRTAGTMMLGNDCVAMVRRHTKAGIHDATYDRDPMWQDEVQTTDANRACSQLRYLIVVRLLDYDASAYIDKKTFKGGSVRGEALVFDLDTGGTFAGCVPFVAESSAFTKASHDSDLATNFYRAMETAVTKVLPDAKL